MPHGDDDDPSPRELFSVFYPRLAGWTARLVDDHEVAHEIASEAFIRLLPRWDEVREPRSWLFMTAGNLARDHWRKTSRERVAYSKVGTLLDLDDGRRGPDTATRLTVRGMVEQLPDRFRMPVLLHYFADLPISEVALALGKAEGTIKRALFDARALMATQLQEVS